jgi:hypothetical protein
MALRAVVLTREPIETVHTMEAASQARFDEAQSIALLHENDAITAAYLFGYVVELLLKSAIGRIRGLLPGDNLYDLIQADVVAPERHDLRTLLEYALLAKNPALPIADQHMFRKHIQAVEENWSVRFRYKTVGVSLSDLDELFLSVNWLRIHQEQLWR